MAQCHTVELVVIAQAAAVIGDKDNRVRENFPRSNFDLRAAFSIEFLTKRAANAKQFENWTWSWSEHSLNSQQHKIPLQSAFGKANKTPSEGDPETRAARRRYVECKHFNCNKKHFQVVYRNKQFSLWNETQRAKLDTEKTKFFVPLLTTNRDSVSLNMSRQKLMIYASLLGS